MPAAIVEVLSTEHESDDPFDLAIRIDRRLRKCDYKSFLLDADEQSSLSSELQLLDQYQLGITHEETKEQAPLRGYGMEELAKLKW